MLVGDNRPVEFDFTDDLQAGETLASGTIECTVYQGTDANPTAVMQGSAAVATPVLSQNAAPTLEGNVYQLLALGTTSLGNVYAKAGLLAVPPASDIQDTTVVGDNPDYDSGLVQVEITPTPVLLAGDNLGGLYQVNLYLMVSTTAASGSILGKVTWTDRLTSLVQTSTIVTKSVASVGSAEDTVPFDVLVGTQILVEGDFSGVVGTPTYQLTAAVVRL